jgi:hypothetical protein
MSRAQLTSTVEQSSGGVVAPFLAGKNKIINGDFSIWQRGTSFSSSTGYTADRWTCIGAYPTTVTQQTFTPGNTITGYESAYYLQAVGASAYPLIQQKIEDVRTFAGQTVTLSFWAKANASSGSAFYFLQNFGSGGSALVDNINVYTPTITTSWARYTTTFTMPSISGKTVGSGSFLQFTAYLSTNAATLSIWGVQLEAGSVATPFTTASNTLQGELALCQRYYEKSYSQSVAPGSVSTVGLCGFNLSQPYGDFIITRFVVTKRTAPTVTLYSGETGSSGVIRDESAGVDTSGTAKNIGDTSFGLTLTGYSGRLYAYHFIASAEL